MNGISKITISGKDHVLHFGLAGCLEFERRFIHMGADDVVVIFTALIYSGMFGNAVRNGEKIPEFSEAYDIMEALESEPDKHEQALSIWNVYNESSHGKDFKNRIKAVNDAYKVTEPGNDKKKVKLKKT